MRPRIPSDDQNKIIECLVALYNDGHYAEAEREAVAAIALFPQAGLAWKVLWYARGKRGQQDLVALRKVVELLPDDADAWVSLGLSHRLSGHLDEAVACYRTALAKRADYALAYCNLGDVLNDLGRLDEAAESSRKAVELSPRFAEAHVNLARSLMKKGKLAEAAHHFRIAAEILPSLTVAHQGLNRSLSTLVPKWHVPMVNEGKRNAAYFAALGAAINADTHVLEIGTGTGLLALIAAKHGAKRVTTCEMDQFIAQTAKEIVEDNGFEDVVRVVPKRSTDLHLDKDLSTKADVLVAEVFSNELLAEHVLPSIEDAKRRLLKPGGAVIPGAGSIIVGLFGGADVARNLQVEDQFGFNLQRFNTIVPKKVAILRNDLEIKLLSNSVEAFRFDFQNDETFPSSSKTLRIPVTASGTCLGLVQWIRLEMTAQVAFENRPDERGPVENWQRLAFLFPERLSVKPGQVATISASHDRSEPWFRLVSLE